MRRVYAVILYVLSTRTSGLTPIYKLIAIFSFSQRAYCNLLSTSKQAPASHKTASLRSAFVLPFTRSVKYIILH